MTDSTSESESFRARDPAGTAWSLDAFRDHLRQTRVAAGQAYRLSLRNRWAPALVTLFAAFGLLVVGFGGTAAGPRRVGAVVVSLAGLATYLLPLAALSFGYDAIVGADEAGWLDVTFALPVARSTVVAGTYLGRAVTLAGATALGFGAAGGALLWLASGGAALYARFLLGATLTALAFLAVATLLSAVAAEKSHALGMALLAWVWFVFLHDLVAITAVATLDLPTLALSAFVLGNPADCFRVLVLAGVNARGGMAAALATTGLPPAVVVTALIGWCVVPVAVAARLVDSRSV
ncbi:MAG: ABC transporter permease [Halobacteriaceae archaeon]